MLLLVKKENKESTNLYRKEEKIPGFMTDEIILMKKL